MTWLRAALVALARVLSWRRRRRHLTVDRVSDRWLDEHQRR